jgi:ribonucleases P/MRP protein subunit RPP40
LEQFILDHSISVCVITETWLNRKVDDNEFPYFIKQNFIVFRTDRGIKRGGGVAILVSAKLAPSFHRIQTAFQEIDLAVVSLNCFGKPMYIAGVYRPPGVNDTAMRELIRLTESVLPNYNCILCGDFNLPQIDWAKHNFNNYSELVGKFIFSLNSKQYQQFVTFPTHKDGNTLDLVLCNRLSLVCNVRGEAGLSNSDHFAVLFGINAPIAPRLNKKICSENPNFHCANFLALERYFASLNWPQIFSVCLTTDQHWDLFLNVISEANKQFIPKCKAKQTSSYPYKYSKNVKNLARQKRIAHRRLLKALANGDSDSTKLRRAQFKFKAKIHKNACKRELFAYEESIVNNIKNPNKQFWSYVNKKRSSGPHIPAICDEFGNPITDSCRQCDRFGETFSSVFVQDNGIYPSVADRKITSLSFVNISAARVYNVMRSLPSKFAAGPDGLPAFYFKKLAVSLALPLSIIYQVSLARGEVPAMWRNAIVLPIYKRKGDSADAANYRPISLTCCACKIMESVVREDLYAYCQENSILSSNQHGGRKGMSTVTQLLECLDNYFANIDNGNQTNVVLLDYSKAFDTVSHQKLLAKLDSIGVRGNLYNWLKSFLFNRSYVVKIGDNTSKHFPVISGIPQGGVISPLLFLIYINGVTEIVKSTSTKLFFDDLKLYDRNTVEGVQLLQSNLEQVCKWSDNWQLSISSTKSAHIQLGFNSTSMPTFSANNEVIETVDHVRDLGVIFDTKLSFAQHIAGIVTKGHRMAGLIRRSFSSRDPLVLYRFFCVFVRPILEYASQVWSPSCIKLIKQLESVQRRFTKNLPGMRNLSYKRRLLDLHAESLESRRMQMDLTMLSTAISGKSGIKIRGIDELFFCNRSSRLKLKVRKHTRKLCQHFWLDRSIAMFNKLPDDLRRSIVSGKGLSSANFNFSTFSRIDREWL